MDDMRAAQVPSRPPRTWAILAIIGMLSRATILAVVVVTELTAALTVPDWAARAQAGDWVGIVLAVGLGGGVSASLLTALLAAIAFLIWLHAAIKQGHSYGIPHPNATPGGALVCWFIPFINLVRPYTVIQSLYQTSRAHAVDARGDWVRRWPLLLPLWWVAWILGTILTNISFKLWSGGHVTPVAAWLGVVAAPLVLIAAASAAAIVWSIQANQDAIASAEPQTEDAGFGQFQPPGQTG